MPIIQYCLIYPQVESVFETVEEEKEEESTLTSKFSHRVSNLCCRNVPRCFAAAFYQLVKHNSFLVWKNASAHYI